MKLLILSDLHYCENEQYTKFICSKLEKLAEQKFDSILLCGDNAELDKNLKNHHKLFDFLQKKFECKIGFVCGNHDLYSKPFGVESKKFLYEIFPDFAEKKGLEYLEDKIIDSGNCKITGTYGHYDYSFARITEKVKMIDILNFSISLDGQSTAWADKWMMDVSSDKDFCSELLNNFGKRIKKIDKKNNRLITLSHTIPSRKFSGHYEEELQNFLAAYSGSKLLEDILKRNPVDYHFCGHTHKPSKGKLGNCEIVNIGADFYDFKYQILKLD